MEPKKANRDILERYLDRVDNPYFTIFFDQVGSGFQPQCGFYPCYSKDPVSIRNAQRDIDRFYALGHRVEWISDKRFRRYSESLMSEAFGLVFSPGQTVRRLEQREFCFTA